MQDDRGVHGVRGVPWAFPTLFSFYFVLQRAAAQALAVLLIVGTTTMTVLAVGWPMAARFLPHSRSH